MQRQAQGRKPKRQRPGGWGGALGAAGLAVACLVIGACAPRAAGSDAAGPGPAPDARLLAGGQWDVTALNGQPVLKKVPINITFAEGRVFGAGSCNRFIGSFRPGAAAMMEVSPLATTMMACPGPVMAQEQLFLGILKDVTSFRVEGATLTLETRDGRTITAQRKPA